MEDVVEDGMAATLERFKGLEDSGLNLSTAASSVLETGVEAATTEECSEVGQAHILIVYCEAVIRTCPEKRAQQGSKCTYQTMYRAT